MKKVTTILALVMLLIFASSRYSFAYLSSDTIGGDGDYKLPVLSSSSPMDSLNRLIDPLDYLDKITKKLPGLQNIGTTMPSLNLNLLNTKNLSSTDLTSALKAVLVLAINLFLIVIQTVAAILKALLPFLS